MRFSPQACSPCPWRQSSPLRRDLGNFEHVKHHLKMLSGSMWKYVVVIKNDGMVFTWFFSATLVLFARSTDQGQQLVRSVKKCRSGSQSDPCMPSSSSFCNFEDLETNMTRHGSRYSLEQIELVCKDKDAACSAPVLNRSWSCWVAELKWIVRKDTCVSAYPCVT